MTRNISADAPQLHPLHRALKESWQRLVINKKVKQAWLALRCEVDESRISRWINPGLPDFPPTLSMALFIEALQEWPGVEKWEPLDAFNQYFGCHVAPMNRVQQTVHALAGIVALDTGKLVNAILDASRPDSDGGTDITAKERRGSLAPISSHLRRVADDLDDLISSEPEEERRRA